MSSKKVIVEVPLKGTNVKKGVNYVKNAEGKAVVAPDDGPGPGRPTQHDPEVFAMKSTEIIQTIGAKAGEMYLVAVAYFDPEFVAHKEGERVRLQSVCRRIGERAVHSKRTNYARLLKGANLKYRWLVDAAKRSTPEGRLLYLAYLLSTEPIT
jgi:hypothetical protein